MRNLKMCMKCNAVLDANNSTEYDPILFVDKGYKLMLVKCGKCQSLNTRKHSGEIAVDTVLNERK